MSTKDKPDQDRLAKMLSFAYTCACQKRGLDYEIVVKLKKENVNEDRGKDFRGLLVADDAHGSDARQ